MADDLGPLAVSIAECKAYLRLESNDEDAQIAGFIRTAMALCEAFTGRWLIVRAGEQRLASIGGWQRILTNPVIAISGVSGQAGTLSASDYETDIDEAGTGWVRLLVPGDVRRPRALFSAGIAADWNGVPESLRQGIIRLVVHLFTHRDAADSGPPPAAVAAMWRPWRMLRI